MLQGLRHACKVLAVLQGHMLQPHLEQLPALHQAALDDVELGLGCQRFPFPEDELALLQVTDMSLT